MSDVSRTQGREMDEAASALRALFPRRVGWGVFYGLTALAWLIVVVTHLEPHAAHHVGPAMLLMLWVAMSAAMMLPTFHAALGVYLNLKETGAATARGAVALQGGFLTVWLGFAIVGAALQSRLAAFDVVDAAGASASPWLNAALLLAAGLYQFSALKEACLSRCRHPLTFFLERWQPGAARAFRMGVELGVYCMGCCWALMALGFIGGTMNLLWMVVATLFMTLEKLPRIERFLTAPAGVLCLIGSAVFAAAALV